MAWVSVCAGLWGEEPAILNIFNKVKEIMSKEIGESIRTIYYQIENINKKINYKSDQNRDFKVEK